MKKLNSVVNQIDFNEEVKPSEDYRYTSPYLDPNLYDCEKCNNEGYLIEEHEGREVAVECGCMRRRETLMNIKNSNLQEAFKRYTFENYVTDTDWRNKIKDKAKAYLKNQVRGFYIGGQIGAGKTHICTAIAGRFVIAGYRVKHEQWRELTSYLRSNMNDDEYYFKMDKLKKAKVLYIDDFLKTEMGKPPTESDLKIAWELINSRYQANVKTIISSEHTIRSLMQTSEAIGSRIVEMTETDFMLDIKKDMKKNYRLKGMI